MRRENKTAECVMLQERVFSVKRRFLAMYHKAHAGHIGSSLSCAELLVFLRFAWMREHDTFVLSKGHAAAALYSLLAEVNRLTPSQIDSFYEEGTLLSALPPVRAIEEIPFAETRRYTKRVLASRATYAFLFYPDEAEGALQLPLKVPG